MHINDKLILTALQSAFRAGKAIMDIYREPFEFELKADNSPLTIADKTANSIITESLSDTGLPIISEEGAQVGYDVRKNWKQFWLVDPLDGTKEFIQKNGDFTINIALISKQQAVFGVVYAPVQGFIYWGSQSGSFRLKVKQSEANDFENVQFLEALAVKLPHIPKPEIFVVLGSRSHMNAETESFIRNLKTKYSDISFISRGSSLKFCILAEGGADLYPRFGPTMEWDTAAGHAVAFYAGCTVEQVENGLPVVYNKPSLLNPNFIATSKKK